MTQILSPVEVALQTKPEGLVAPASRMSLSVWRRLNPPASGPGKNPILDFPWPKSGEKPRVAGDYLRPTDEEKKKVRDFIAKNDRSEMDPLTGTIVRLAKDLIHEVH